MIQLPVGPYIPREHGVPLHDDEPVKQNTLALSVRIETSVCQYTSNLYAKLGHLLSAGLSHLGVPQQAYTRLSPAVIRSVRT